MKLKLVLLTLLFASQIQAQTKVWFDTDIMIGMPDAAAREVDDASAYPCTRCARVGDGLGVQRELA